MLKCSNKDEDALSSFDAKYFTSGKLDPCDCNTKSVDLINRSIKIRKSFPSIKELKSNKIEEAKPLMKKISDNYKKLLDYFPKNTKVGFKTEALPSIWENKDEFNALMQKASDDMIKLAKAIETAEDLRAAQKELMWSNCTACHSRFRAPH